MTKRGSVAFISTSQRCSASSAVDGGLVAGVELDCGVGITGGGRLPGPSEVVVCDDQLSERTAGGNTGESRAYPASPD